jgi:hypothetical protein
MLSPHPLADDPIRLGVFSCDQRHAPCQDESQAMSYERVAVHA